MFVVVVQLKQTEEDLTQELVSNRATNSAAIYHLLVARLTRYERDKYNTAIPKAEN